MEAVEKVDVFMPFYVGDYLADTEDLIAEEHGAYILLMLNMWRRGGSLPDDEERLRRIAKVDREHWPEVWAVVARFFEAADGRLTHKRLGRELDKARKRSAAGSTGGKASAQQRQSRREESRGNETSTTAQRPMEPNGNAHPNGQASENQRSGKTSHSHSHSGRDPDPDPERARDPGPPAEPEPVPEPQPVPGPGPAKIGAVPTAHDVLHWFGLAWRDRYEAMWVPEPNAPVMARKLIEDQIGVLPRDEQPLIYADIRRRITRYLEDDNAKLVEYRHPFKWFCERFSALGASSATGKSEPAEAYYPTL
jgi:uncharacterized protein YdaU (DUF1376 family)